MSPDFQTIDEAVSFWESHDSADFWDKMEEVEFEVELRQNLLAAKPIVLAYRPEHCPQCGQDLEDTRMDYLTDDSGHLLMVRNLPILRCGGNGHLFMLEETFDRLERLMSLERQNKTKPVSSLTIPVYEFAVD
jgi:hypothetical protein